MEVPMKINFTLIALIAAICTIAGCSTYSTPPKNTDSPKFNLFNQATPMPGTAPTEEVKGVSAGGSIRKSMDNEDVTKMSRAMDKSPGKSTHWVNGISGTTYTVTPIRPVAVKGSQYCRAYKLTATNGSRTRETSGVACVGADTNWKDVRN